MAKLTRQERETVITFNEADDIATIFTYSQHWIRHLEEDLGLIGEEGDFGAKTFEVPKKSIRRPIIRTKREYTEKELEEIRTRLAAGRELKAEAEGKKKAKPKAKAKAKPTTKPEPPKPKGKPAAKPKPLEDEPEPEDEELEELEDEAEDEDEDED